MATSEDAVHMDHPDAPSLLQQYPDRIPGKPRLGGAPRQIFPGDKEGKEESRLLGQDRHRREAQPVWSNVSPDDRGDIDQQWLVRHL